MKNQTRSRRHFKTKATAGAFSGRNGPRLAHPAVGAVHAAGAPDPWIRDWSVRGLPIVALLPDGVSLRRI